MEGTQPSDKLRLHHAFEILRSRGYTALMRFGFSREDGVSSIVKEQGARDRFVFYTEQEDDRGVFDINNRLARRLALYWRGNKGAIEEACRASGLAVEPGTDRDAVMLRANPSSLAMTLAKSCAEAAGAFGGTGIAPKTRDEMYSNTAHFRDAFREWVRNNREDLFPVLEEDVEVVPHDDIYLRYLGFALPPEKRLG